LRNARIGSADRPDDWVVYLMPVVSVLGDHASPYLCAAPMLLRLALLVFLGRTAGRCDGHNVN
jgi:hypothetical protein